MGRRRPGLTSTDRDQISRRRIETVDGVRAASHNILDSHPELTWDIYPWLYGESHAGFKRKLVPLDDVRVLVSLQSNPVAGPMDELLAKAALFYDVSRGAIHCLTAHSRFDSRSTGFVCGRNEGVDLPLARRRRADYEGPSHV